MHLRQTDATVEGDHAYVLKGGDCLVVKGDVVLARIPASSFSWVEYVWNDAELEQRQKTFTDLLQIVCGWCGGMCDTAKDGFHLVHVAFGVSQKDIAFVRMNAMRRSGGCIQPVCTGIAMTAIAMIAIFASNGMATRLTESG